jgi:hypothetical protein
MTHALDSPTPDRPNFGTELRTPQCADLPYAMREAARIVGSRLKAHGVRGWIVGGAVRDLALGRDVKDVDMVSAATPLEVEGLFEGIVTVGRAFGILIIPVHVPPEDGEGDTARVDVELATFRTENGYTDSRHPDVVHFAATAEEDAVRRDFTCNALYLDPLDDTCLDPTGGLGDLRAGALRAVGDAAARFREDGLRIMRMARFLGQLGLNPCGGLIEAARDASDSLDGVSSERILDELGRTLCAPHIGAAVDAWLASESLPHALPQWWACVNPERLCIDVRTSAVGGAHSSIDGLAIWLDPDPLGPGDPESEAQVLGSLPLARSQARLIREAWPRRRSLMYEVTDPAQRARLLDGPTGALALRLAGAWKRALGLPTGQLKELVEWRAAQGTESLIPDPLLNGHEVMQLGLPAGPRLGEVRDELIDSQLRGQVSTPDEARAWVRDRL